MHTSHNENNSIVTTLILSWIIISFEIDKNLRGKHCFCLAIILLYDLHNVIYICKVTSVRRKVQRWAVWDKEDQRNGWEKILLSNWSKKVDKSWQKEPTCRIIN